MENEISRVVNAVAPASLIENWIDGWSIAVTTLPITNLSITREKEKSNAIRYSRKRKFRQHRALLRRPWLGPTVLIHGYPLSGASWEKQVPVLLKAGYRVITYDRRGFGKSSQPTEGYNYDTFAEDLHKLVTQLKLHDFTLVGFSMGAGEVARYIGKFGSKGVSKAVIISGVPPYLLKTSDNPEGVDASVFAGIEKAVAADRYAFFTGFFQNFYNTDLLLGKRVSEQAVQASWNVAAGASATASLACVSTWHEDFRKDLARIDVPTLVIHGDADRILPITAAGQRTAKLIKGASLLVVKDGPHCIPWTHAEEVNAELLSFLGGKAGKSQTEAA
jgi:non-heme chloroperoxidase